jgi:hypothetical protein
MNQQTPGTARERGLRRAGMITAVLAAAGVVGSGAVAVLAHADTVAQSTTSTGTSTGTSAGTSDDSTSAGSTDSGSGGVTSGSGSVPQAQSAGS